MWWVLPQCTRVCSNSQVLAQQQSNTLYKEILGDKHYYGKTVFQCCHAVLSILFCSSCCYSLSSPFGLASPAVYLCLRSLVHSSRRSLYVFTLLTRSPNWLFPLLVFVLANQSRASCSYCLLCFLPTLFNQPLALFRHHYLLFFSFFILAVHTHALMRGQCKGGASARMCTPTNLQVTPSHVLPYL